MEGYKHGNFEEQFSKECSTEVYGHELRYIDCIPESQKFDIPLFVAPGWAETPETFKEPIRVFHDSGRRVLSVEHIRYTPGVTDADSEAYYWPLSPDEKRLFAECGIDEDNGGIPISEIIKARDILAVIKNSGIDMVDVVAHSEGAINSLMAALLEPDRFRNIILVGAGGITEKGEDNALKRTVGFARTVMQDARQIINDPDTRTELGRAGIEVVKYLIKDPMASVEEIGALSSFNIEGIIARLAEKGIKISIVHGGKDRMFPMKDMEKMIEKDSIYEFYSLPKNDHHSIYLAEEAGFISGILDSMEKI